MNIVLDLDGVLADFAKGYEKLFHKPLLLPEQEISRGNWKKIDNAKDFWLTLPPLPGVKYLAGMGEIPDNVYILTSRNQKKTFSQTMAWLDEHGLADLKPRTIFANPRANKVASLEELAPAVFLDDSISNVDFCGTVRDVEATLMLQIYNAACAVKYFPSMRVVKTVKEFIESAASHPKEHH